MCGKSLVLLLSCFLASTVAIEVSEAEQMSLEISGVMLPPKKLTRNISEHLKGIRKLYPEMENIRHRAKWAPGEVYVYATEDDGVIGKINGSRYGPVNNARKMKAVGSIYHVVFNKPYHPERLVERLRAELGLQEVEGVLTFGDGNDIAYEATAPTYSTYRFQMGWGDCSTSCIYKHFWEFSVAPSEETLTIRLEKEYGSDVSTKEAVEPK